LPLRQRSEYRAKLIEKRAKQAELEKEVRTEQ
jgi:hypothetical protein